uniref:Sodefrin-like factor n=1 Tax=Ichthyosaura alpestris TaxID=54263 RepID=A0A172AZC5_ICHAP|nr:sodefrin precursor-like factor [Ichthyosaura alpestris]
MRALLAAAVMLQALITGDCLSCEQCFALHTSSCSGVFTQCPPDVTHCVAGLENTTLRNDVILTAFKDCLDPSQKAACGREFYYKTSVFSLRTSRTCCDSDLCNGGDVKGEAVRPYSERGCATPDYCKIGVFNLLGVQVYDYALKCSPALKV